MLRGIRLLAVAGVLLVLLGAVQAAPIDGKWKITSWRLRYDRLDPLPREPLPKSIMGGPDALRDANYLKLVVDPRGS